jgi:hypothetical protein
LLQINQNLLEEKEKEIQKLIKLIKEQKEKIIDAYLHFFTEKKLLRELIEEHLKLTRFKEQGISSCDYDEKCEELEENCKEIRNKLRNKLPKETMNEVRIILKNCEKLVE